MNLTRPSDIKAQLQKLWDRGEILADLVLGAGLFPRRLALKGPTSMEIADHFAEVREWSRELRVMPGCRVVMREFRHKVFGANAIPHEIWIDDIDQALAIIGRRKDRDRFASLLNAMRQQQPGLLPWLARRPLRALELHLEWQRLLSVVAWLQAHPRPDIYLRQVDIPGVDTKFIEAHRGVLSELLDIVLPMEAIDTGASGVGQFAPRYGFRGKPLRVRFRILDATHRMGGAPLAQDISLDAAGFAALELDVWQVFVTENEINFLAFPPVPGSIVVFGAGYGFEMISGAAWLRHCVIRYWGDIDTHGFAMLDQLRARFDHVESFLMDRDTLLAFEAQWGEEEAQTARELTRLRPDEQALYNDLRDNRLRKHLRLEQERVGFEWVKKAVSGLR